MIYLQQQTQHARALSLRPWTDRAAAHAMDRGYAPLHEQEDRGLMARRLPGGEAFNFRRSDHSAEIAQLRTQAVDGTALEALTLAVAADLLEAHDETGISLDDWLSARLLVELLIGKPILENDV